MLKSIQRILIVLVVLIGILTPLNQVLAQDGSTVDNSTPIQNQAQVVKIKQASETEIQNLITQIKTENESLSNEILTLKNQEIEQQSQVNNLSKNLKEFKTQSIDKNPNLKDDIEKTKQDLDQAQKDLLATKNELALKQAKFEANSKTLNDAQANLTQKKQEVKEEVNTLQQQIINFLGQFSLFISLILGYWFAWQLIRFLNKKLVKNNIISGIISTLSTLLAILATFATLLVAFIGNLTLLVTSFGVFSAALVVALQDFVSSFFAWILIRISRIYRIADTISITTGKGVVTGVVTSIGLFRTIFKEKVGGTELDNEKPTGKILSFPNNLVLKESVTNFTKNNNIIWHSFNVTITFESDHRKAKEILETICKEQFQYALDHEQQYFAGVFNIKQYKSKVYMYIAADGPQFTIWFATKIGFFRDRLEKYSEEILDRFAKHNIELAYTTNRIIYDRKDFITSPASNPTIEL